MSTDTTAPCGAVRTPASPRARDTHRVTEHRLEFAGFGFVVRWVHQDDPVTAPLVILGGSSQDRFSWVRHQVGLAPLCDVLTVDLPGYGDADELPARYGMDFLAAAVRHLLDELELRRVNMLGGCFGGAVALRFAQHYPASLARLALVGMSTYVTSEYNRDARRWLAMLDDDRLDDMARELVDRFMARPGDAVTIRRHAALSRLLHRQFLQQTPRQIRMGVVTHNERLMAHEWYRPEPVAPLPALVFTGEHDHLTVPAMGRQVAARLAGAFTTVQDADHLVHMERIEEFTELVARFLTDRTIDDLPWCNPVEHP